MFCFYYQHHISIYFHCKVIETHLLTCLCIIQEHVIPFNNHVNCYYAKIIVFWNGNRQQNQTQPAMKLCGIIGEHTNTKHKYKSFCVPVSFWLYFWNNIRIVIVSIDGQPTTLPLHFCFQDVNAYFQPVYVISILTTLHPPVFPVYCVKWMSSQTMFNWYLGGVAALHSITGSKNGRKNPFLCPNPHVMKKG